MSPLRKPLGIKLYNDLHFHPQLPNTTSPHIDQPSSKIVGIAFVPHAPAAPFVPSEYHPVFTPIEILEQPSPEPPHILAEQVLASRDRLFFILYTQAGTMRQRWYLVQIDLQATEELISAWKTEGNMFVSFSHVILTIRIRAMNLHDGGQTGTNIHTAKHPRISYMAIEFYSVPP